MRTAAYYSAMKKNEVGSFVETWMDLESTMQSEVSQKSITDWFTYVESRRIVQMILFAKQK